MTVHNRNMSTILKQLSGGKTGFSTNTAGGIGKKKKKMNLDLGLQTIQKLTQKWITDL